MYVTNLNPFNIYANKPQLSVYKHIYIPHQNIFLKKSQLCINGSVSRQPLPDIFPSKEYSKTPLFCFRLSIQICY